MRKMLRDKQEKLQQMEKIRSSATAQKGQFPFKSTPHTSPRRKSDNKKMNIYVPPARRGVVFDEMEQDYPMWLQTPTKKPMNKSSYASLNTRARRMKGRDATTAPWRKANKTLDYTSAGFMDCQQDSPRKSSLDKISELAEKVPDDHTKTFPQQMAAVLNNVPFSGRMTNALTNAPREWMSAGKVLSEDNSDDSFEIPELEPISPSSGDDQQEVQHQLQAVPSPMDTAEEGHNTSPSPAGLDEIDSDSATIDYTEDTYANLDDAGVEAKVPVRDDSEVFNVCQRPFVFPSIDVSLLKTTLSPEVGDGRPTEPCPPMDEAMIIQGEVENNAAPIHVKFLQPPDSPEDLTGCTIENILPPPPGFPMLMPEELLKNYWTMPPKKRVTARMHTGPRATTEGGVNLTREMPSQLKIKKLDADIINDDPKLNMATRVDVVRLLETEPQGCELDRQRKDNYNKLKRMLQEQDGVKDPKLTGPIIE
jgi:hypothetical protein